MTRTSNGYKTLITRDGNPHKLIKQIAQIVHKKRNAADRTSDPLNSQEMSELTGRLICLSDWYGINGSKALRKIAESLDSIPGAVYNHNFLGLFSQIERYRSCFKGEVPNLDLLAYYVKSKFTDQREAALLPSFGNGRMPGDSGRRLGKFNIQDRF